MLLCPQMAIHHNDPPPDFLSPFCGGKRGGGAGAGRQQQKKTKVEKATWRASIEMFFSLLAAAHVIEEEIGNQLVGNIVADELQFLRWEKDPPQDEIWSIF